MSKHKLIKELEDLFEFYGQVDPYGRHGNTSLTMIAPSTLTVESATKVLEEMDMEPLIKDLATILAREMAKVLLQANMRPATYSHMKKIYPMMIERIKKTLDEQQEEFSQITASHLGLHG